MDEGEALQYLLEVLCGNYSYNHSRQTQTINSNSNNNKTYSLVL